MARTPEQIQSQLAGKAMLGGVLWASLAQDQAKGDGGSGLILSAEPLTDLKGEFIYGLEVTMRSGTYKVLIVEEETIEEL